MVTCLLGLPEWQTAHACSSLTAGVWQDDYVQHTFAVLGELQSSSTPDDLSLAWEHWLELEQQLRTHFEGDLERSRALVLLVAYGCAFPGFEEAVADSETAIFAKAHRAAQELGGFQQSAFLAYWQGEHWIRMGRMVEAMELFVGQLSIAEPTAESVNRCRIQLALADVLRLKGEWDAGLVLCQEAEREIKNLSDRALVDWSESRANLLGRLNGLRTELHTAYGLPAAARKSLEAEQHWANQEPSLAFNHALHKLNWMLSMRDFAGVVSALDAKQPLVRKEDCGPQQLAKLALFRNVSLAELEWRDKRKHQDCLPGLQALWASPEDPNTHAAFLDSLDRLSAGRYLCEIHLRRGDVQTAQSVFERLQVELAAQVDSEALLLPQAELTVLAGRLLQARNFDDRAQRLALGRAHEGELERVFARVLAAWKEIQRPIGGIGFLQFADRRAVLAELMQWRLDLHGPESGAQKAFEDLWRAQSLGSRVLAQSSSKSNEVPSLDDVRAALQLSEKRGLLGFLPGRDRVHVFALDGRGLVWRSSLGRMELVRELRSFETGLARHFVGLPAGRGRLATQLEAAGAKLFERLMPTDVVERMQAWDGFTLVGFNLLSDVSLECLALAPNAGKRQLVGERWAVSTISSLPLALARSTSTQFRLGGKPKWMFLLHTQVSADTSQAQGLDAFRLNAEQVAVLRAEGQGGLPSYDVVTHTDSAWDLQALDLSGNAVTHLVVHGSFDSSKPRGAALVLPRASDGGKPWEDGEATGNGDRLVYSDEIEALQLGGLVILSACGSAMGEPRPGDDELTHLGGAFLAAGAQAVVLTRERIEKVRTLALMGDLQAALVQGASPDQAMQTARKRAAQTEDPWSRWYAARFQVLGAGERGLPAR